MEQWQVGDKCMAPYSGDGLHYRACIKTLTKKLQGRVMASVRFSGFTEEEDEIVDVRHLKKRPARVSRNKTGSHTDSGSSSSVSAPSVSSPLKYMTEEDRLRTKYADLFDDGDDNGWTGAKTNKPESSSHSPVATSSSSLSSSRLASSSNQKRKIPVAVGGELRKGTEDAAPPKKWLASPDVPPSLLDRQPSEKDSFGFLDEGFSCEEMEKPFFPGVSSASAKVPLVLSQDGSESVVQVPATVNRYLRDYQREGVRFLYQQYRKGEGGILGDDMGLGKTVQVLAFLCAVLGKTGTREDCQRRLPEFLQKKLKTVRGRSSEVFLIICPNSVLYNWLDEFDTWTYCTVGKYHGRERQETLWKAMKGKLDVVITSYETYRIYMDSLLKVQWAGVIADEVHKIKEPGSQITQALREVNTKRRYGLTGTALQNKLSELWCVLDWANPDCLGSLAKFKLRFEDPISKGQKFHASKRELAKSRKVSTQFAELRDHWMIRRTKALISHQLPTKDEKVVFCKLTELQVSIYKALLESEDMQLVLKQKDLCDCGSGGTCIQCCYKYNPDGEKVKALTMTFMSLLIKVANHVALLTPDVTMSDQQRRRAQKYCDIAFARHPQFVTLSREARFCTLSDPSYCGKMQILEKLLAIFKQEGSKVLLFSYYTQLLNIIEMYLKTTDYVYRRLDGKTPAQDRQKFVHEFNRDPDIFLFLISTKAGGLGLNLTGANVVVLFDPNWNPTYDLQAQDRAYRIGQHRDVRVYRLISTGSIEENMYLRQVYKQQLASAAVTSENPMRYFTAVAGDQKQQGELFGLHNMFALRADTSCLTRDLIQRHGKTEQGITLAKYIPPPPTQSDADQISREEALTDSDRDSDSSHGNRRDASAADDHGVASQFLSDTDFSDYCEEEMRCDPEKPTIKEAFTETGKDVSKLTKLPGKTTAENGHKGRTANPAARPTLKRQRNRAQIATDLSSGEDEPVDRRATRGKAILHKDGRIERRVKGTATAQPKRSTLNPRAKGHTSQGKELKVTATVKKGLKSTGRKRNLTKEKSKVPANAVDDVFRECGVSFIHSNAKIVGGSRVEDHVSNIAVRDVYDLGLYSQQPANYNVPTLQESMSNSSSSQEKDSVQSQKPLPASLLAQSQQASHRINGTTVLFGQTPRGIKRHHFEAMAKTMKHSSVRDFAKHILSLPQEQYANLLQEYYTARHPQLEVAKFYQPAEPPEAGDILQDGPAKAQSTGKSKPGRGKSSGRAYGTRARHPGGVGHFESLSEDSEFDDIGTRTDGNRRNAKRCGTEMRVLNNGSDAKGETIVTSTGTSRTFRTSPGKQGSRTRTQPKEHQRKSPNSKPPKESVRTERSHKGMSKRMHSSNEEWLGDSNCCKKADQSRQLQHQTEDENACVGKDASSESPSTELNFRSALSPSLRHGEGSMTFLDEIFLAEPSRKPPKPPPKKKSPKKKKKTIHFVRGDLSDSDVEMEDLSDLTSTGVNSFKTKAPQASELDSGTLWRRNANFNTFRQSALEQAVLEAQLESQSVFEKYAESFVPNEHFLKRGFNKECNINVKETDTSQDNSCSSQLRPSPSLVPETVSL
ncbi:DNA excision repair protein ERCC-6-like 2 [Acanthaster planci]|uniref:DNA excision repair protein ERCC-6-like 2 n=1 Tax=Acanthaster planci TaxID=133434 RepID=A0A8B7Y7Q2_ACAPL|nr:DNA excision repair protein ERCC-6-like 2 [Acanthaster planci]XP_022089253.1 DNA excision repair protein ERCC-6-like 2 [Acanthaster planci]